MRFVLLAASLVIVGCRSEARQPPKFTVSWRPVGSWAGRGNTQTESFELSGRWRIRWETKNETSPGAGTLRVSVNSAVSARPLAVPIDHQGPGHDTADVTEDPHLFYLVIDSSNIDWSITAEQPVASEPGAH